jgi:hypothetical protein
LYVGFEKTQEDDVEAGRESVVWGEVITKGEEKEEGGEDEEEEEEEE